ncbi:MAG: plasmid pRiA4b ORF-3 family protein [Prevotella sp.]|jgi:hypothetical protein|nr:plasmid pRiA4b ORF-3 family protein [Prevotella sp.]
MTLTFKIQLRGIKKPPVWRRIEIPAKSTFEDFHVFIQVAFGWWNAHLYQFQHRPYDGGWIVKTPSEYDDNYFYDVVDASTIYVSAFLKKMGLTKFVYVYDFGDDWIHDITLEKVDEKKTLHCPVCLAGKGACPPEDCGGPWGYEEIKRLFAEEPDSEETKEYREWMGMEEGEEFDPTRFNIYIVNGILQKLDVSSKMWKKV